MAEYLDEENYHLPYYKTYTSAENVDWDIINEDLFFYNKNTLDIALFSLKFFISDGIIFPLNKS